MMSQYEGWTWVFNYPVDLQWILNKLFSPLVALPRLKAGTAVGICLMIITKVSGVKFHVLGFQHNTDLPESRHRCNDMWHEAEPQILWWGTNMPSYRAYMGGKFIGKGKEREIEKRNMVTCFREAAGREHG